MALPCCLRSGDTRMAREPTGQYLSSWRCVLDVNRESVQCCTAFSFDLHEETRNGNCCVRISLCARLPTYADNVALPAFAPPHAAAAATDRYLLTAGPTVANLQQRVCCCGPLLWQTDGWTPCRFTDSAPRTMRGFAGSGSELQPKTT